MPEAMVRPARADDLEWVAVLAGRHRAALSFVSRVRLAAALARGELLVAGTDPLFPGGCGFCLFHRRRDGITVVYALVSEAPGMGRALVEALARPVRAKCPSDLPANGFWRHLGARLVATEPGRRRALNVWELR